MPVSSEAGCAKLEVRLAIERGGFDVAVVARLVPVGREQQQHVRRTPGRQVPLTGGTEPTGGMRQTTTTEIGIQRTTVPRQERVIRLAGTFFFARGAPLVQCHTPRGENETGIGSSREHQARCHATGRGTIESGPAATSAQPRLCSAVSCIVNGARRMVYVGNRHLYYRGREAIACAPHGVCLTAYGVRWKHHLCPDEILIMSPTCTSCHWTARNSPAVLVSSTNVSDSFTIRSCRCRLRSS